MSPRLADILSLIAGLAAAAGLAALIIQVPPAPLYKAAALTLILIAVAGVAAPLWRRLLRQLIGKANDREIAAMGLRFGVWTGLFIASLVLLRVIHFLDRVLILAILLLLIMIEMFLQQHAARKRRARRPRR
ncbi:MAG TPA: hypothetical protein G4O05_09660 [Caldilineae bacterium]|nr:hypothetical protein [Caldilineae bacterium]